MTIQLRKAERKQAKLRIGITAPSGAGKTYSSLRLARGLASGWDKIAIIDTENGSGELYSNLGSYNVISLDAPFTPERYIEAIQAAEQAGMEVIIVDSVTHEWDGKGGCLESNDLIARTKFKGNTWAAWSVTTPRHRKFIDAITQSPCHIITTTRSKTDTIQTEDKKIKKVGMKEIQRDGYEYEMTINFSLDRDGHYAIASKDRTGLFSELDPFLITEETGKTLISWNGEGKVDVISLKREIIRQLDRIGLQTADGEQIKADILDITGLELKEENFGTIIEKLSVTNPIVKEGKDIEDITIDDDTKGGDAGQEDSKWPADEDNKVGKMKMTILRKIAKDKAGFATDNDILAYVESVYGTNYVTLDNLGNKQGDYLIAELSAIPSGPATEENV